MVSAGSVERALLLLQARRPREAVAAANEVLAVDPDDFEGHRIRALAHRDLGFLDAAWADVQFMLAQAPEDPQAHVTAVEVAWDRGAGGGADSDHWKTVARAHVAQSMALRPSDVYVLWLATLTAPSAADAERAAERVAEVTPDSRWARLAKAEAAVRSMRWGVAVEALRAELAVNPDDLYAIDWLSRVLPRAEGRAHRSDLIQLLTRSAASGNSSALARLGELVTRSTRVVLPSVLLWFGLFLVWAFVRNNETVVQRPVPELLFASVVAGWAALRWWLWRRIWPVIDSLPVLGRKRLLRPMFLSGWSMVAALVVVTAMTVPAGWPPTLEAAEADQEYEIERVTRIVEVPTPTVPAPPPPPIRLPTVPGRPPMTAPQITVPRPPMQVPRTVTVSRPRFEVENLLHGRRLALASAGAFAFAAGVEAVNLLRVRRRTTPTFGVS